MSHAQDTKGGDMAAAATATVGAASSSPIQRAVTGNDAFVVEQEILLKSAAAAGRPRVDTARTRARALGGGCGG